MKPSRIILLFLFFGQQLMSQEHIAIKVTDNKTKEPISYALVQNRMNNVSIIVDEQGFGYIPVGDSTLLKTSAISYEDSFHFVFKCEDSDTINIQLKHKTYELKELVVHPYPTRILFKKAIADLHIPDTNAVSANLFMVPNLKGYAEQSKSYAHGDVITIGLGSPISGIYNLVSRRERSKRKLQKLQWNDNRQAYIQKRYNRTYVEQLLGIKKLKEIEAFMKYCQPDYEYLLASTDYELACYVLDCYQSFLLNHQGSE